MLRMYSGRDIMKDQARLKMEGKALKSRIRRTTVRGIILNTLSIIPGMYGIEPITAERQIGNQLRKDSLCIALQASSHMPKKLC